VSGVDVLGLLADQQRNRDRRRQFGLERGVPVGPPANGLRQADIAVQLGAKRVRPSKGGIGLCQNVLSSTQPLSNAAC